MSQAERGSPGAPQGDRTGERGTGRTPEKGASQQRITTLRLDNTLYSQLSFVAQVRKRTISEEIRSAVHEHVDAAKRDDEFQRQAREKIAELSQALDALNILTETDTPDQLKAPGGTPQKHDQ